MPQVVFRKAKQGTLFPQTLFVRQEAVTYKTCLGANVFTSAKQLYTCIDRFNSEL